MTKKTILYVSNHCFPDTASGIRVTNISLLLSQTKNNIFLYSNNDFSYINEKHRKILKYEFVKNMYKFSYNSLNYYYQNVKKGKINKFFNLIELFTNYKQFKAIKTICKYNKIDTIILYNPVFNLTKLLLSFCRKNNIKLIIDNTEWYEVDNYKKICDRFIAKSVSKRIKILDKKVNNIISISPWMNNWYKERNIKSICVMPLITNFYKPILSRIDNDVINIIYCGIPGEKDLLLPFIECIKKYNSVELFFKLTLIGIGNEYFDNENLEKYNIYAIGKIPHSKVFEFYKKSDFSCLFRKKMVYAKAGFSTKVAESLSYGVPVICNDIGGTDIIINNDFNGYKMECFNEEHICKILDKILLLSKNEYLTLKINSYETAKKFFSISSYVDDLNKFID